MITDKLLNILTISRNDYPMKSFCSFIFASAAH